MRIEKKFRLLKNITPLFITNLTVDDLGPCYEFSAKVVILGYGFYARVMVG